LDMDGTLIAVKSGKKFAHNANDWIILNEKVIEKVKEYHTKGYKIVIFTNQAGIEKGHTKEQDIKTKIENITELIGVPIQALIASHNDYYRKPSTGMWKYFASNLNGGKQVNIKESLYIGDAAGRAKEGTRPKDHSAGDYQFALNVGLQFKTPEMHYHNQKETLPPFEFEPKNAFKKTGSLFKGKDVKPADIPSQSPEMVIFVGSPGSGKSSFWKNYLPNYVHVNNDTLKTKAKCLKVAEEAMAAGKSVVIDNTNPKKETRAEYSAIAKKHGYPVRCFYFDIPKDTAFHLNELRVVNKFRQHQSGRVPDMPIHAWYKNHEKPTTAEGFTSVETIEPVVGPFINKEEEELFFHYLF